MVDKVTASYLSAVSTDEAELQAKIVKAREYHAGEQATALTDRLRDFLSVAKDQEFNVNITKLVVNAFLDRMLYRGVLAGEDQIANDWANRVHEFNRLDARQDDIHEDTIRDGEAFVIVSFDDENRLPVFTPYPRYTGTDNGGDGVGCFIRYPQDDPNLSPKYAVKRWVDYDEKSRPVEYATLYYPDRVEKYRYQSGWQPYQGENDETWPLPWVDLRGNPLGIAVVHFQNTHLNFEAKDVWPLQDALNKAVVDMLGAGDLTAFRLLFMFGGYATTDGKPLNTSGSNAIKVQPGSIVSIPSEGMKVQAIEPADLNSLLEEITKIIHLAAVVSSIPLSRFRATGLVSSEPAQVEEKEPFEALVGRKQSKIGNAWEDCYNIARRLQTTFGGGYGGKEISPDALFSAQWRESDSRTHEEKLKEWEFKQKTGIPDDQIWREMGYSEEQIKKFKASESYRQKGELARAGLNVGGRPEITQNPEITE